VTHHEELVILHFVETILALGKDKAVGLSVHGLGAESCGNKVDFLAGPGSKGLWEVNELDFDANVFLRGNAFTLCAIMISAGLIVELREDSVALSILDFVVFLQVGELPAHKRVEVGVSVCGEETAAPVSSKTKVFKVLLAMGREEVEPVVRVLEAGDVLVAHANLLKNFILSEVGLDHFRVFL
jgi:hypothetical protein